MAVDVKAVIGLFITEPQLALVEISEDPAAIRTAARSMLRDMPAAGDNPFTRARTDMLERIAKERD